MHISYTKDKDAHRRQTTQLSHLFILSFVIIHDENV